VSALISKPAYSPASSKISGIAKRWDNGRFKIFINGSII